MDYYAVITYITEYMMKDDTAVIRNLTDALKSSKLQGLKEKMSLMMNTWLTCRQMGEAETIYKLFRDFHLRESSQVCVFLQACPRKERSKYLVKANEGHQYTSSPKVFVEGREGECVEKYDSISKYERREVYVTCKDSSTSKIVIEEMSLAQFIKMYKPTRKPPKPKTKVSSLEVEGSEHEISDD